MTVPNRVQAPSEDWGVSFPRAARGFAEYAREYWDLNAALAYCSSCLDEIRDGERTRGAWYPDRQAWS